MRARRATRFDEIRLQQQALGVRLRWTFESVVTAPVPPEWLDLLRRADERLSTTPKLEKVRR